MRKPIFVRALTNTEREQVKRGLRSRDAFGLGRSQIVLASAAGERAPAIASRLGCDDQTVREVIVAFNERGLGVLERQSCRPHRIVRAFELTQLEPLGGLLHQSPRTFGKATSLWSLALAAEVSLEQGLTAERVSGETIRNALKRLGVTWKRAKRWITSPDPEYGRKKTRATA